MVEELTGEQTAAFKKAFNMFDKDKQGFIHTRQIGSLLRTMGQAFEDKDLRELIAEVDADTARFVVEGDNAKTERELKEAFKLYDRQGNGYINVFDFREILRALDDTITQEELDEMIAEIDTDRSGTVDFNEFMETMTAG